MTIGRFKRTIKELAVCYIETDRITYGFRQNTTFTQKRKQTALFRSRFSQPHRVPFNYTYKYRYELARLLKIAAVKRHYCHLSPLYPFI